MEADTKVKCTITWHKAMGHFTSVTVQSTLVNGHTTKHSVKVN